VRLFLIWLSGARTDLLARSPGDKAKYEGVGATILFTATLAGVSMIFALNTALSVFLALAILAGVAWAMGIMQLDRWLVVSIQRRDKAWQNLYMAVPRLMLAVLFGVVISTPLVLQIFRPEIEAKVVEIRQQDADAFRRQQQSGAVGTTVSRLTTQRDALQKIITSGGDVPQNPEADPRIVGLRSQLKRAQSAAAKAKKDWDCQLYGPCEPKGNGPLARADEKTYREAQRQVSAINRQIEDRKSQLTSSDERSRAQRVNDAKAILPQVESQLRTYTDQQKALQKNFEAKNRGSAGLLMQLKALDQVAAQNTTLNTARLLLLLLITIIECLPVLVKLMLTLGPPNSYEKLLAKAEAIETSNAIFEIQTRNRRDEASTRNVLDEIWGPPGDSAGPSRTRGFSRDDQGEQAEPRAHEDVFSWEDTELRRMPDGNVYGFSSTGSGFDDYSSPSGRDSSEAPGFGRLDTDGEANSDTRPAADDQPGAGVRSRGNPVPSTSGRAGSNDATPADDLLDFDEED
jgi:hypothetical protein